MAFRHLARHVGTYVELKLHNTFLRQPKSAVFNRDVQTCVHNKQSYRFNGLAEVFCVDVPLNYSFKNTSWRIQNPVTPPALNSTLPSGALC